MAYKKRFLTIPFQVRSHCLNANNFTGIANSIFNRESQKVLDRILYFLGAN